MDTNERFQNEVLAQIREIAAGVEKLRNGPLNDRAILLLLQDVIGYRWKRTAYSKISLKVLETVLDGIESMEEHFLRDTNDGN